ncbi:MAG: DUF2332 domain-containing protein [Candidatus Eremiobacteraeota bacterium]|nr:DUF2332 domain-containing protein [Candidatus Eremiobacteraeota bacterium]MBC5828482.1 DUF2332 domain-containing protein [Candidatus Eremiobacteraeota bacterium]
MQRASEAFSIFRAAQARSQSRLYSELCRPIAADEQILGLLREVRKGQPMPNLLFAAVHYLLLAGGGEEPLARFYADVTPRVSDPESAYPLFREFCLRHSDAIRGLVNNRLVQTNEVSRCSALLPAFAIALRRQGKRSIGLVEIGASAGLNLLWDRYHYDYGAGLTFGPSDSSVRLHCRLKGRNIPRLPDTMPAVSARVGIDLNPIDVFDDDSILWLKALIWPEHESRRRTFAAAVALARRRRLDVVRGDACDGLAGILRTIPGDAFPCVFHTMVMNQLSPDSQQRLDDVLTSEAKHRDLAVASIVWTPKEQTPRVLLTQFHNGGPDRAVLARCSPHGEWLEWLSSA